MNASHRSGTHTQTHKYTHIRKVQWGGVYKSKYLKVPHALRFRSIRPIRFGFLAFVYATINYTFNFISEISLPNGSGGGGNIHITLYAYTIFLSISLSLSISISAHSTGPFQCISEILEILLGILQRYILLYIYIDVLLSSTIFPVRKS